jgi:hypothetical protein
MKALSRSQHAVGGRKLIDLGSGDGRIVNTLQSFFLFNQLIHNIYWSKVMAAGQRGFQSHGVELNTVLVLYSKLTAWRNRI